MPQSPIPHKRPAPAAQSAPSLQALLAAIADATSDAAVDELLKSARVFYAGSMMEQLEGAAAERLRALADAAR